ncbi:MAG: ABC-2 transporter permease [Methanosarcinales archaeon]
MNIKTEIKKSWIITVKEFKHLFRKPMLVVPLFIFPIIMITFFGYGMSGTITSASMLIVNDDTGLQSNILISAITSYIPKDENTPMFEVTYTKDMSQSVAKSKIDKGEYKTVIIIPHDFSENIDKYNRGSGGPAVITILTDTSDTTTSGIVIQVLEMLIQKIYGKSAIFAHTPPVYGHGDLKYMDFLTPAVIALTVFMGTVMGTGRAIAGERGDGTMARMLMTPISRFSIILGKTVFQLILELSRALILIIGAIGMLGVHMNGSWLLVAFILVIFTLGACGMGIAMSATVRDLDSFMSISMLVTIPSMFSTGVFYPLSSMPFWMQALAYVIPLTYANDAMRTVMVKGLGFSAIAEDLIILAVFAIAMFALSVKLFKREI